MATEEIGDRLAVNSAVQQMGLTPKPRNAEPEGEEEELDENGEPKLKINIPKEPEVNPAVYRDVENLLFRGFIVLPAEINGVRFIFKSMNHHELEYLQWVTAGEPLERYYNSFLAYAVFMIDGQNILPERERWISTIEDTFKLLPGPARTKLVRAIAEVHRKAANATTLAEAYQMEKSSRFRWAQLKGVELMSPGNTGIEGTQRLGLNYAQLVWRALNYYDDVREMAEREWDNAKFIGSCFAGKEIKKIYAQDKKRRETEQTDRINRKDQLLRHVILGEDLGKNREASQYQIITARTVEELADQLERDLRGEKDWHDRVVEQEELRLREGERARLQHMREMHQARSLENPNETYGGSDATRSFTPAEVRERVTRQRQLQAQQQASAFVYDERMEQFLKKYGIDEEDGSNLPVQTTDRDPSSAQPVVPPRPAGTPFRRG